MLNSRHETLKAQNTVYLSRLGDYYALLGQLYLVRKKYDSSQKCFESALTVWKEFGMDPKNLKMKKALEFHKLSVENQ